MAACQASPGLVYRHRPTFKAALKVPGVPLDPTSCAPLGAVWAGAVSMPPGGKTIVPLSNTTMNSHRQRATGDLANQ
jgi:hypothetical protein